MSVYFASPLFTINQKERIKKAVAQLRIRWGKEVYSPMEHEIPNAWKMSNKKWAAAVYKEDIEALDKADTVYAIYDGMDSDSGTAWEIGYACGKGKKVFIIANPETTLSLMVVNSANAVYDLNSFLEGGVLAPLWKRDREDLIPLKKILQS